MNSLQQKKNIIKINRKLQKIICQNVLVEINVLKDSQISCKQIIQGKL